MQSAVYYDKVGVEVKNMKDQEKKEALETIDMLAVALANENHTWEDQERISYERSVKILNQKD